MTPSQILYLRSQVFSPQGDLSTALYLGSHIQSLPCAFSQTQYLVTYVHSLQGDVIFQTSKSQQSPLIQIGTRSKITHCGIIVMRGGKPYVLETLKTLVLTPLDKFIARGEDGKYWIKRSSKENIKIKYAKYLGKPYDLAFKFDKGRFYCSELVYDIYQKQLGIQLAEPRQVKDYLILFTDRLPKLKRAMKRRGISKEQYAIAPVDIFNSEYLESVD